jgi:hypothetical protein
MDAWLEAGGHIDCHGTGYIVDEQIPGTARITACSCPQVGRSVNPNTPASWMAALLAQVWTIGSVAHLAMSFEAESVPAGGTLEYVQRVQQATRPQQLVIPEALLLVHLSVSAFVNNQPAIEELAAVLISELPMGTWPDLNAGDEVTLRVRNRDPSAAHLFAAMLLGTPRQWTSLSPAEHLAVGAREIARMVRG